MEKCRRLRGRPLRYVLESSHAKIGKKTNKYNIYTEGHPDRIIKGKGRDGEILQQVEKEDIGLSDSRANPRSTTSRKAPTNKVP